MNNKYLSGLLAGVLTAGAVQGSGNKGKIPEMGEKQTPVVRAQTANELPADLQELLLAFSQSLAERGYRAQIDLSAIQMPTQITSVNTSVLNGNDRTQGNEGAFGLPEMVLSEPEIPSATTELTQLTIGENGEPRQKVVAGGKQLDSYSMLQVAQYMDTKSIKKVQEVNSKFATEPSSREIQRYGKIFNQLRTNPDPVTAKNYKLYSNIQIQTQQIFGPDDYILLGKYQYIITYPVTRAEIESWIAKLKTINEDKLDKPIIVNCQNVNIDEDCNHDYRTDKINLNFDVDPKVRHLVDIKKRKCFLPVVIRDTYENIFKTVVKALADNIVFEKIVLKSTWAPHIIEVFNALKKENICAFEIDRNNGIGAMPSDIVKFFLGYPKISYIPLLKFIDCEKDLFIFVKKIEDTLPINFSNNCNDLDFYAPFLEQSSRLNLPEHSKMYCPYLKKIETLSCRKPEVLYVSQDFDISQLSKEWKDSVKRYTTQQIQEIELAKKELLAYIDINPELSDASLNCPKPASVSQKKWDDLIILKNKLMALLRGENVRQITVLQMQ